MTIRAERSETDASNGRSEFAYGSFIRSVVFPPGADDADVSVTYRQGILTVSVGLSQAKPTENRVQVHSGT